MDFTSDKVWLSKTRDLSDQTRDIQYLALSYCWGGTVNMRSLKENIHHREQHGLFIADLPAVIRDAIAVTRRLKFEYLWVDSLCICQDDEQEWKNEAALMADIYGGSVFTISALSSPNANIGFLGPRPRSIVPIGSMKFSGKGEEHYDGDRPLLLFIRGIPQRLDIELTSGRLSRRGWPLQERILAPGVLHFGRDQVFWECNEDHSMSETGNSIDKSLRLIDTSNDCHNTAVNNNYPPLWHRLIQDFMRRDLSVFSDRLHAISGLAARLRKMGAITGRYVAGLWESELDVLLLWEKHQERLPSTVPVKKNTQVSTWSWAHVDRRNYIFERFTAKSTLLAPAKFKFEDDTQDMQSMCPGAVVPSCQVVLHGFVQEMNRVIIPNASQSFTAGRKTLRDYDRFWFSLLALDDDIDGLSSYYSIRMMDNAAEKIEKPYERYKIQYLVLEQADSEDLAEAEGRSVYKRIGRLSLVAHSKDGSMKPFPITPDCNTRYSDIFMDEGTPLLTNGQWREIILI
ncbi:MAG: hypothetical protein L6R38_000143 [Xanthoria sp. 2 TBL-2021]|nr:MAG: hypothetical protein L6R38_000143 [Xanthoria sp. 2 TBL-2021]